MTALYSLLLICAGVLLIGALFLDALLTTLTVSSGAGPLTSRVSAWLWRGLLRLHRQDSESSPLTQGGLTLLIVTVLSWVLLLWGGWTLVFAGSQAIVDAKAQSPAGALDVLYYTGFTIFTLGTGDFVADSPGWRVVTAASSFTGLFLITLSITYLISVVAAVVQRRALAIQIHGLGRSSGEIVQRGWTGTEFSDMFQQQLIGLLPSVVLSAEQHLAYPVLHFFHARDSDLAAPRAVAQLDEALTLLSKGVTPESRPDAAAVEPLQFAVSRYLNTATNGLRSPDVDVPPTPRLDPLRDAGIPQQPYEIFVEAIEADGERRRLLHQLVASDGWSWPDQ